jgi:hypothetical protein
MGDLLMQKFALQENDAGQGGSDAFNYFSGFLPGPIEGVEEGQSPDDSNEGQQDMPPPATKQGKGQPDASAGGSAFVAPAPPKRKVSLKAKVQVMLPLPLPLSLLQPQAPSPPLVKAEDNCRAHTPSRR